MKKMVLEEEKSNMVKNRRIKKINKLIINTLDISAFTTISDPNKLLPEHYLVADLLMDKIDLNLIVMELEDAFNITISDENSYSWSTMKDIYDFFRV